MKILWALHAVSGVERGEVLLAESDRGAHAPMAKRGDAPAARTWDLRDQPVDVEAVEEAIATRLMFSTSLTRRFSALRSLLDRRFVDWAVVLDTQMRNNKYFGNLRVGSIVDCLAGPENTATVIGAATRLLEDRGVDVIGSNESHAAWYDALGSAGFLRAQCNYIFAASESLAEVPAPFDTSQDQIFLNRGDGDGAGQPVSGNDRPVRRAPRSVCSVVSARIISMIAGRTRCCRMPLCQYGCDSDPWEFNVEGEQGSETDERHGDGPWASRR